MVGVLSEMYARFKDLGPPDLAGEGVSHGQISVEYNVDIWMVCMHCVQ